MEKNKIGKFFAGLYKDGEVWVNDSNDSIFFHSGSDLSYKILDPNPFEDGFIGEIEFDIVPGKPLFMDGMWHYSYADPIVPFGRIK